eukprot:7775396-Pyramimonas_sp.AAC.1
MRGQLGQRGSEGDRRSDRGKMMEGTRPKVSEGRRANKRGKRGDGGGNRRVEAEAVFLPETVSRSLPELT